MKWFVKEDEKVFSPHDISIIGSYSSFLALLLVATVFAVRGIFDEMVKLYVQGTSFGLLEALMIIIVVVFGLVFILVPFIPISITIRRALREGNKWLAGVLIFISVAYAFAIGFQFFYTMLEKLVDF